MSQTLLLVDDHPLFRRGVKELVIDGSELYDIVIEAGDGRAALEQIALHSPDCVMLDIAMPGIDGLATLDIIKRDYPKTLCVVMSMYDNPEFVVEAHNKGARGYILKTDPDAVILDCLRTVSEGEHYVSAALNANVNLQLPEMHIEQEDLDRLSKREREVLGLIAKNCTSKEIARRLALSLRTIQNHRVNICKKLRISGPNALLKVAIENQAWL